MPRAAPGSFDADTHFQNEQFPHPPTSSFGSSVKAASSAKRITFYKSGDAQFKGVKMAIHKRSFKCFDALLDDLSQKVPLPFGVRTITTPRGTHSIKHLEQLEDGGCYLCSDRRYVKPINIEAAGKRLAVWHHHNHPHNPRRKPSRPEESPSGHQHHYRHPKRIVLVKNNDPAVRRSIILSRRTARSLRVFMDEISELMQCHVKKLYTLEGRKIDNIQSLMQCPSVLVCVGREPFRPLLMESLKKLSDEKLPGMGTRSHSSICSESHESKKNGKYFLLLCLQFRLNIVYIYLF
ncbi:oxygen-regulated protein 1 isoform X2 [Ctenopharyngodon idella]|uniref:oxygen-regulated protein 1 isoform X2 n=1 Tax=Ctenopharyngodon idella TaxID=7959 RepID=UPI002231FB7A|nr:oxygen-regulated protein 1 isoform X2 [Ctenopharyngodon idella]